MWVTNTFRALGLGAALALTGCVSTHTVYRDVDYGPPPYGAYYHQHDVDLVWNAGLGVYAVVGFPALYWYDGWYWRQAHDHWERCDRPRGGHWARIEVSYVPVRLSRGHGRADRSPYGDRDVRHVHTRQRRLENVALRERSGPERDHAPARRAEPGRERGTEHLRALDERGGRPQPVRDARPQREPAVRSGPPARGRVERVNRPARERVERDAQPQREPSRGPEPRAEAGRRGAAPERAERREHATASAGRAQSRPERQAAPRRHERRPARDDRESRERGDEYAQRRGE